MHDTVDWPVAFLGSLHAGIVPVAVNTLLTPDDYAYMITHSRSQAVFVSGTLLDTLQQALSRCEHEVRHIIVAAPTQDRKSTRLNSSHSYATRMPSSAAQK